MAAPGSSADLGRVLPLIPVSQVPEEKSHHPQAAAAAAADAVKVGVWDADSGVAPLHLAAARGAADCVAALLAAGAPVDGLDGDGATALQVGGCVMWFTI